jgi:hypothetical protein
MVNAHKTLVRVPATRRSEMEIYLLKGLDFVRNKPKLKSTT